MSITIAGKGLRSKEADLKTISYKSWFNMINRCYSPSILKRRAGYMDCYVCEEWLIYENFKEWYDINFIEGYELDKDFLQEGASVKVYSPETCIFLPKEINGFLTNKRVNKGKYPTGVSEYKGRYKAQIRKEGRQYCIGIFSSIQEAEYHYIVEKEKHLNYLLNKYNLDL